MFLIKIIFELLLLITFVYANGQKQMSVYFANVNQGFIDSISKNTELEELNIYESGFEANVNYEPLKQLNHLSSLTILQSTNVDLNIFKAIKNLKKILLNKNSYIGDFIDPLINVEEFTISSSNNIDFLNDLKGLKILKINSSTLTQNDINMISELTNLEQLTLENVKFDDNVNFDSIENLNKLTKLITSKLQPNSISEGFFKNFKNLEILSIEAFDLTQSNYEEIIGLNNLKELSFLRCNDKDIDFKSIKTSSSVNTLNIYRTNPYDFKKNYFEVFNKLQYLKIYGDSITQDEADAIVSLADTLKEVNLLMCSCNGKPINFGSLTNSGIIKFNKDLGFDKCILNYNNTSSITITTTTSTKVSSTTSSTKCGKGYGKCPSGECCSKYGWCGKSTGYCLSSRGCQSEFGQCIQDDINKKCGKGYGKCPSGSCCSKYGWCGKSYAYCSASKGCQSEYGQCHDLSQEEVKEDKQVNSLNNTEVGRCGKGYGNCPTGHCCSKYGWCGQSSTYCSLTKGCQSEFGQCQEDSQENPRNNPTENIKVGRCGKGYGNCPTGYCCSKYGWCGQSSIYCFINKGCQSDFGQCQENSKENLQQNTKENFQENSKSEYKCGKDFGKCPSGECCSKYGWCGKSTSYCLISRGCQSEFGKCL